MPRNLGDHKIFSEDFLSPQSVHENGGIIVGAPTISNGASLNGSSYINYPSKNQFSDGSSDKPFTVVAEITMNDATNFIIAGRYFDTSSREWVFGVGGGDQLYLICYDESTEGYIARRYSETLTAQEGTRIHVVATYSGSQSHTGIKLYLNGGQVDNTNISSGSYNGMELLTGGFQVGYGNGLYADGVIHRLDTYNGEWTAEEVLDDYQQDTYQELDSSVAILDLPMISQYADASGNQRTRNIGSYSTEFGVGDLTTSGTFPAVVTDPIRAFDFDGAAQYLKESVADWQGSDTQGTIMAWILLRNSGYNNTILASCDEGSSTKYLWFRINSNGKISIAQRDNDTADEVVGDTVLSLYQLHFVAVTTNGSRYKLYLNGQDDGATATSGSNGGDWFADTSDRDNVTIGVAQRQAGFSLYHDGLMTKPSYRDFELTPRQIRWFYEKGLREMSI